MYLYPNNDLISKTELRVKNENNHGNSSSGSDGRNRAIIY